jgi:hypothetical protein
MNITITEVDPAAKVGGVKAIRTVTGEDLRAAVDIFDYVANGGGTQEIPVRGMSAKEAIRELSYGSITAIVETPIKAVVITYSGQKIPVHETVGEISQLISQAKHDEGFGGFVPLEPNILIRWDRIEVVAEPQE